MNKIFFHSLVDQMYYTWKLKSEKRSIFHKQFFWFPWKHDFCIIATTVSCFHLSAYEWSSYTSCRNHEKSWQTFCYFSNCLIEECKFRWETQIIATGFFGGINQTIIYVIFSNFLWYGRWGKQLFRWKKRSGKKTFRI